MTLIDLHMDLDRSQVGSAGLEEVLRVASHEIRQPVAAVLALAEAARMHPDATPELQAFLDRIVQQATHISETTRSVLDVEHLRLPRRTTVDVDELVYQALEPFRITWTGNIARTGDSGLFAIADPVLLRRSLVNIVENATRAAGPHGLVAVHAHRVGAQVAMQVDDDGPGFGNIRSGTRIGLPLTERALTGMGGALTVGSSPRTGGARVVLTVPALDRHERDPWVQDAG